MLPRAPHVGRLEVPEDVKKEEGAHDDRDVVEVADCREHHEPRLPARPKSE